MPKQEQTTTAVFTRLTAADLKTLRAIARKQQTTSSAIIRRLTEQFLAEKRAEQANLRKQRAAARRAA